MTKRLIALLAVLAMLMAACGDDDDNDDAGPDDTGTDDTGSGGEDWPSTLVLTLQPAENADQLIGDAQILGDLIADRIDGIDSVEAQVPTDYQAVIVALQSGAADIGGGFGPVNVARAIDQAGAEPILQSERFGEFLYVSQWFTNDPDTFCEDEPVAETYEEDGEEYTMLFCNGVNELASAEDGPRGLEMLENAGDVTISFVSEGSASGQVFPSFGLIEAGYDLDSLDTIFAGGHPESVLAVANGDATIGVSFNDAREELVAENSNIGEQVVVFAWSAPIPNDAFVVRGDLPEDLKAAITEALLEIANDEEAGQVLRDLYNIDGFRPADPADFENARRVDQELGELLG